MKRYADIHTHTPLCGHASGTPEEYVESVLKHNLSHYGISDHFPLPPNSFSPRDEYLPFGDFQQYRDWIAKVRALLEGSDTRFLYGAEFDYLPGQMDLTLPLLQHEVESGLDYRIFSIHFAFGYSFDCADYFNVKWGAADGPRKIWGKYLENLNQMVGQGGFEIIGHIDLPKLFGIYPENYRKLLPQFHDILKVAAAKNICIEINTAGIRKKVGEMYPAPEILKMAHDAGVQITMGSDAHKPEQIALYFDRAIDFAKSVGYRSVFVFEKLRPIELPV